MDREQEILRRLRQAVDAGRPDVLDAVLAATRERPQAQRVHPGARRLVRRAGLLGTAAALLLIVFQMTGLPPRLAQEPTRPPVTEQPPPPDTPIRETGYQVRALATEPDNGAFEDYELIPNEPMAVTSLTGSEAWDCAVGVRQLADGRYEYKTHLTFSVFCEGEGIETVRYTVSDGQLERRVQLDSTQLVEEYAERVDHINVGDGSAWGYLPLGASRTVPYRQQYEEKGMIGLQLIMVRDEAADPFEVQKAFAARIQALRLTVTMQFADGSKGQSVLGFEAASFVTGGLNIVRLH